MAATAASIATPVGLGAKECPTAGMDWITMSLEARNLAYNNVEHVGPDNARKKTESWAAASKMLREQPAASRLGLRQHPRSCRQLQNIRLGSATATPLSRSRNQRADE